MPNTSHTTIDYAEYPAIVVDFLRYLDVIKNKSPLTVQEYATDLRTFLRFLKMSRNLAPPATPFDQIDITDLEIAFFRTVSISDAYAFLSYCKNERHNNAKTRSRKVSSIRGFFKYLTVQKKLLEENPMQELDTPKQKKSLPKYLTLDQSITLLNHIDGKNKERDFCIITFFLNCGMRLSELVGLNLSDIQDEETMRVTGKGDKERILYLNQACRDALRAYLKVRPVDGVRDKNALFLSNRMQRISPKTVQHIVYTFLEKAGLSGQGLSVHKLRHTAATLMYQHGKVDVLVLKEILGHENLGTTEIYTHIMDDQIKSAIDANPLHTQKPSKTSQK